MVTRCASRFFLLAALLWLGFIPSAFALRAPSTSASASSENRVGGSDPFASSRLSIEDLQSPGNAMGSEAFDYESASGRLKWLNQDPIGERGGINLYRFNYNNSITFVDPDGQSSEGVVIGGAIGTGVGYVIGGGLGFLGGTIALPGVGSVTFGIGGAEAGAAAFGGLGAWLGSLWPSAPNYAPIICHAEKAPGAPGSNEGYAPPKRGLGSKGEMVKNPNGPGRGYLADDGGVWVPTGEGSLAHGGPHWDVQYPGGGHKNVYPGGRVR